MKAAHEAGTTEGLEAADSRRQARRVIVQCPTCAWGPELLHALRPQWRLLSRQLLWEGWACWARRPQAGLACEYLGTTALPAVRLACMHDRHQGDVSLVLQALLPAGEVARV